MLELEPEQALALALVVGVSRLVRIEGRLELVSERALDSLVDRESNPMLEGDAPVLDHCKARPGEPSD